MPSLRAFGRKWAIASDDFVFPALTEAAVRGFWLMIGALVFYLHYPFTCEQADVRLILYVLIALNVLTILMCYVIAWISSRGIIMDPMSRRSINKLLYLRVPLFAVEIIWTFLATILTFEGFEMCNFNTAIRITVGLEWILIGCVLLGVFIVFNPADDVEDAVLMTRRVWSRRLSVFKIRQDQLMRSAIDDIANMVASFFIEGDYVFSDIAAGLLLVVHSPANCYPPLIKDEHVIPSWMTIESARHFAHFATCVYGWPSYLMHNLGCRPYLRLFRKMRCCGQLRCDQDALKRQDDNPIIRDKVLVVQDNCCACNTAAFVLSTEQNNMDLFFVSFQNALYETPFVVLADHDSKSIVITIRGSCSLMDLVTDLCLDDEILSVDVDSDPVLRQDPGLDGHGEVRVHRGMLRSARYVYDQLRKHQILEDLNVLYPTYGLVICGHSLGAGVASLLTLLLKQQNPTVRCFSFAPPGCVISEEGQEEMREHVMSVVTRDDMVPRISYQSMHQLRMSVIRELNACRKAKYEILIKGVFRLFFQAPWELSGVTAASDTDHLVRSEHVPYGTDPSLENPTVLPQIEANRITDESRVQLYAPGKVLYLSEEDSSSPVFQQWIDPKCLSDIKLSASSVTDHLPKFVNHILKKADESVNGIVDEDSSSPTRTGEIMEV